MATNSINARMTLTPESRRRLLRLEKARVKPELRKSLMASTKPIVSKIKSKARSLPSKREGRRTRDSLRSELANATTRRVGLTKRGMSVTILVQPKGGKSNLARSVEGVIPWKHPTFGHSPIVDQPAKPFFYKTIEENLAPVEASVRIALIELERKI